MDSTERLFHISNALLGPMDDVSSDGTVELEEQVLVSDGKQSSTFLAPEGATDKQKSQRPRSVPSSPRRIAADKALNQVEQQFETPNIEAGKKSTSKSAEPLRSRTNTSSCGVVVADAKSTGFELHRKVVRRRGNASTNTDNEQDILESENWSDDGTANETFQFTIAPTLDDKRVSLTRRPTDRETSNQSNIQLITTEQNVDPDIIVSIESLDTSHLPDTLIVELPERGPIDLATIYDKNAKQAKEEDKSNILLSYINASVNKEAATAIQTWTEQVKSLARQTYGMTLQDSMQEIEASVNFDTEGFIAARNKRFEEANRKFGSAIDRMSAETTQMIAWRYERHTDHVIKRCDLMTASDIHPATARPEKE